VPEVAIPTFIDFQFGAMKILGIYRSAFGGNFAFKGQLIFAW
jgi:hypothetical protein